MQKLFLENLINYVQTIIFDETIIYYDQTVMIQRKVTSGSFPMMTQYTDNCDD